MGYVETEETLPEKKFSGGVEMMTGEKSPLLTPELAWFVLDFFKKCLNGYEKLLFYSYYVNGMTLKEISGSHGCSWQLIGRKMQSINKKLHQKWKQESQDDCK